MPRDITSSHRFEVDGLLPYRLNPWGRPENMLTFVETLQMMSL
jgi:hypothetical protein